jgi:DMSO reductase anchor subunit
VVEPQRVDLFVTGAIVLTALGAIGRMAALLRNERLKPRSTIQSAIGVKHPQVVQRSMGFMGGSFNTREFFQPLSPGALRQVMWWFVAGAFVVPLGLLVAALATGASWLPAAAFVVQYGGLLAERWFFLAQSRHPQNLYYQAVS